jgi:hypothetical protein
MWLILVSKRPSGPQQSHPFIWFWLKNCLKIKKIKNASTFFSLYKFWKSFVFLTEKGWSACTVLRTSDQFNFFFYSLVLLVYKISGGVHKKHGGISNPNITCFLAWLLWAVHWLARDLPAYWSAGMAGFPQAFSSNRLVSISVEIIHLLQSIHLSYEIFQANVALFPVNDFKLILPSAKICKTWIACLLNKGSYLAVWFVLDVKAWSIIHLLVCM